MYKNIWAITQPPIVLTNGIDYQSRNKKEMNINRDAEDDQKVAAQNKDNPNDDVLDI